MKFSVVIPTRGDQDLTPILESYDGIADEVLIWDNSKRQDLSVYGRYAMIEEARNDLILTQDDDCVVSDPQQLLDAYSIISECSQHGPMEYGQVKGHWGWMCFHADHEKAVFSPDAVVCNMPPEFRHEFYEEHALVGFGACFHRDAPQRAFIEYEKARGMDAMLGADGEWFRRTCDIVFTALTPRVLVDVPVKNLWWAEDETRMWRQEKHIEERTRMLELVKKVRDA